MMSLKILKRDGDNVSFNPQKIYNRVKRSAKGLNVNSDEIFIKVITSVPTEGEITTKELDKLVYEIAASYTGSHHDYSRLASSVAISSYHKETNPSFSETMMLLYSDDMEVTKDTLNLNFMNPKLIYLGMERRSGENHSIDEDYWGGSYVNDIDRENDPNTYFRSNSITINRKISNLSHTFRG